MPDDIKLLPFSDYTSTAPRPYAVDNAVWQDIQDYARRCVLADREGRQWQPIETAPRDGSTVLLRGKGDHRIADGYWLQAAYNGNGAWVWPYVHSEPVTWMPIPAGAQRAKGDA